MFRGLTDWPTRLAHDLKYDLLLWKQDASKRVCCFWVTTANPACTFLVLHIPPLFFPSPLPLPPNPHYRKYLFSQTPCNNWRQYSKRWKSPKNHCLILSLRMMVRFNCIWFKHSLLFLCWSLTSFSGPAQLSVAPLFCTASDGKLSGVNFFSLQTSFSLYMPLTHCIFIFVQAATPKLNPSSLPALTSRLLALTTPTHHQ